MTGTAKWRRAGPSGLARDFAAGLRYFGQGAAILAARPQLLVLGIAAAVVTTAILLGGMIALVAAIGHVAAAITPFASGWPDGWRVAVRVAAGIATIAAALALGLVAFTTLTLAIGGPFYERIAERIEDDLGATAGHVRLAGWQAAWLGAWDSARLLLRSLMAAVAVFAAGFLPVVGQSVVPALAAVVTAWFLALEATGVAFYRRGIGLRQRTRALRRRRALALGLGLPAALLSTIPLMTLAVMPVLFAGGVLVALDALGALPGQAARIAGGPPG